ncbi:hypothetical protein DEO72_LG9g1989 [Vigna unguiculata]|uniref:Uncharacterized protein n=1 Tax=Vigna unguiculata TaxID=3917 RepID=A0A4D6N275_VIGUN|nr:hypothetical protein DEO72_LG9g1989 [Vigna unguiculata]
MVVAREIGCAAQECGATPTNSDGAQGWSTKKIEMFLGQGGVAVAGCVAISGVVALLQVGGARRWKMVMVVREISFHGGPRLEDGGTVVARGLRVANEG